MKRFWEAVYLVTSALGAAIIAFNINANVVGYCFFLVSSVVGGVMAYNSNASHTIWKVNVLFAVINIIGIVRYF